MSVSAPDQQLTTARAAAPATCGELFQGTLGGEPCLVSLPIDRWSVVELSLDEDQMSWASPPEKEKSRRALLKAAADWDLTGGGSLHWLSQLPVGKGYGSSTADIGAALSALAAAAGEQVTPWQATWRAIEVEPTDSSLLPGLALLHHRDGKGWRSLGPAPAMSVFVVDTGGTVDTDAFNRMDYRAYAQRFGRRHEELFAVLVDSLESGNLEGVGWVATECAKLHQSVLPKPGFERWLRLAQETGALGVNVAHSGTLIGLLYRTGVRIEGIEAYLRTRVDIAALAGWSRTIGGGVREWNRYRPVMRR